MIDEPNGDGLMDLIGQPFSVCPGTVYAQIGWYSPEKPALYLLNDTLSPAERLKPVYLYCGNIDAYENSYDTTEPCA
jgi:hypothetical protein